MTRQQILLFFAATLCVACSRPPDTSQYPTLLIDEKHWDRPQSTWEAYEISPSSGIRVDTTQFQFKYGTETVVPDVVHLILNDSQMFKLAAPAVTGVYLLDRDTLKPMQQSGPFTGFHSGDRWIMVIGTVDPDSPQNDELYLSWFGQVKVN